MESHDNEQQPHSESDQHAGQIDEMGQIQAPASLLPGIVSRLGLEGRALSNYSRTEKQTGQRVRDLSNPDWTVRIIALRTLSTSDSQATMGLLLAALHDTDASVRATAVRMLGTLGEQAPLLELVGALSDPSWHVREMAVQVLGELGERAPREPMLLALQDTDASVRESAVLALAPQQEHTSFSMHRRIGDFFKMSHNDRNHANLTIGEPAQKNFSYAYQQEQHRPFRSIRRHSLQRTFALSLALIVVIANIVAWVALTHRLQTPANGGLSHRTTVTLGNTLYTYRTEGVNIFDLAWSPDSRRIVEADRNTNAWDATTGSNFVMLSNTYSNTLDWSPDGTRIASGGMQVQVMNASTGQVFVTYPKTLSQSSALPTINAQNTSALLSSRFPISGDNVTALAWSPNGKYIASALCGADYGHRVDIWDATTGQPLFSYHGHSDCVNSLAWSPDSKRIASASGDHTVQVWDAMTGGNVFIYHGHSKVVSGVAWSPDGNSIASVSADNTLQVWNAITGHRNFIHHLPVNVILQPGFSVAWSPVDARIAVGGGDLDNGFVQLVDAIRGTLLYTYTGNLQNVGVVKWSPNGKYIASGDGEDSSALYDTVKVWATQ